MTATDFGTLTLAGFTLDEMESVEINFSYSGREPQRKMGGSTLAGITRGAFTPSISAKFYVGTNFDALRAAAMSAAPCSVLSSAPSTASNMAWRPPAIKPMARSLGQEKVG